MSTPEAKVKDFIDNLMKKWFPNAVRYAPPGVGYFGRNGMPDRIWILEAAGGFCIVVMIEAKADNGKPTDLQIQTLKQYAKLGAICSIVVGKNLSHMERIRHEILRRLQLAHEKFGSQTISPPERNDEISSL